MNYVFDSKYIDALLHDNAEYVNHFSSYFGALLRTKLRSKLRNTELVDNVIQETLLRVMQQVTNGKAGLPERLPAFVNSVCNNVMLEAFRVSSHSRGRRSELSNNVDEELISEERRVLVQRVLEELPARDRELLIKVFFEDRSQDEICERMDVDAEYLRVLIQKARARFRLALRQYYPPVSS